MNKDEEIKQLKPEVSKMKTPMIHFYEEIQKRLIEKNQINQDSLNNLCCAYFTKSEGEYFNNLYNQHEN